MKIDTRLAIVVGVIAVGTGFNVFWNQWGWKTPNQHSADIITLEQDHADTSKKVLSAIQQNRDEWWCDEEEEYLDELLALKDRGNDTAALDQEIDEQRAKMTDVKCYRFDDRN